MSPRQPASTRREASRRSDDPAQPSRSSRAAPATERDLFRPQESRTPVALRDVAAGDPASGAARPTLYLIDGYALIYRAFFALLKNPLRTTAGEDTSAPYGMATFLLKLYDDYKPDYVGVVLDSAKRTYRHEVFPDYKATRQKMPDELASQIGRVRQLFEVFRIPIIEKEGYEADDVIGTLVKRAAEQGFDPYIVTGNDLPLEPGMAFSVEPGIYLAGRHGARIEDIVVCTDGGVERLNTLGTELVEL